MRVAALCLLLSACSSGGGSPPPEPTGPPASIEGRYIIDWQGQSSFVTIEPDALVIDFWPCAHVSGQWLIGGPYEYTPDGAFRFAFVTFEGSTTMLVQGVFGPDRIMNGTHEIRVFGQLCAGAVVRMVPAE